MKSKINNKPSWFDQRIAPALNEHQLCDDEQAYFVYQLDSLKEHLANLQQQDIIKLWFAVKANPLSAIIKTFNNEGFNFDVASSGELAQVLAQGVNPKNILNTGPAKTKKQLTTFVEKGVETFVVESINQLQWLNEAVLESNDAGIHVNKPTVLLRVQLQWHEGESNPLGGNTLTPFGLSASEWQGIHICDYSGLNICGLHIFQWGNMLNNEKMFSLWSQMIPPLKALADGLGMNFEILDLGGGLGIDYSQQGQELSWAQILKDLADIKQQAGVDQLWLELGRFAVADCGYYVVPVVDRKMNYGQEQLVLAAGINHLLRPAITEQAFPVTLLRNSDKCEQEFNIHGPLCTSMDKLGYLPLPSDVDVGDKLIFGFCGAYGFTESMPFFLCHELAAEYVYQAGALTQIRAAQPASVYLA